MQEYLQAIAAIVAIISPLDKIPIFLGITQELSARDRLRAVGTVTLSSGVIRIGAVFFGRPILRMFGFQLGLSGVGNFFQ